MRHKPSREGEERERESGLNRDQARVLVECFDGGGMLVVQPHAAS